MNIEEIINELEVISSYIPSRLSRSRALSLCHNSKYATPFSAFFCKRGATSDGHRYAKAAYDNGARVFIAERELDLPEDAAVIIIENTAQALNVLAVKFYNSPAKELRIIGITGTKGKTTVALSAYKIALSNGISAGYIGTNGVYYNDIKLDTDNTTPDVLELQKILRKMSDAGISTVMLEISSQAIWQERTYGLEFEACVFTNLYKDHIGGIEHPTLEHYRASKKRLFTDYKTKNVIINSDSEYSEYILDGTECEKVIRTSSSGDRSCDIYALNSVKYKTGIIPGVSFEVNFKDGNRSHEVFIPFPGLYSVENALLTISVCMLLGIKLENILRTLKTVSIPGRFEVVRLTSKPESLFIIDYAHNGSSLKAVIDSLREYKPNRIICLFGSVGGRTYMRRSELGAVARDNADVIIITSDNPNNEDPMRIIEEIRAAVGQTDKPVYMIGDRTEAVRLAYELAEKGDHILLAGKGHESYQLINGRRMPFSERHLLEQADLESLITIK